MASTEEMSQTRASALGSAAAAATMVDRVRPRRMRRDEPAAAKERAMEAPMPDEAPAMRMVRETWVLAGLVEEMLG